jgi:hypothetical protein
MRCADCRHCYNESDAADAPSWRCGVPVPMWVPLSVHDYQSWNIEPNADVKCNTFAPKSTQPT